jgi:hypothetical protein
MNTTTENVSTTDAAPTAVPISTPAVVGVASAMPTIATAPPADVDSIMRKMAEQQTEITKLNEQLQTKSDDNQKLSEKQRKEMKHIYDTVIAGWVDQQDTVNVKTRDEFKNGIMRLADEAKDDNGIWQVVMCASSASQRDRESAAKKESEFQALHKNYEELKTRVEGGRFSHEDARVGSKRAAADAIPHPQGGVSNIWDQFGDFMKTSYNNDSFTAPVSRNVQ